MWKAYLGFDAYLIERINTAYLWLLDRTGVYVATLAFITYTAMVALLLANGRSIWFWLPVLAFVGLSMGHKYLMQDKGQNDIFNLGAMQWESWRWRHYFNISIVIFIIVEIIALTPIEAIIDIGFVTYGYLLTIKIRDRDKKPFFEKQEQLAMQEHGSN